MHLYRIYYFVLIIIYCLKKGCSQRFVFILRIKAFYQEQRPFWNSRNLIQLNLFNKIFEPTILWAYHLITWNKTFKLPKIINLCVPFDIFNYLNDHDPPNVSIIFPFLDCLESDILSKMTDIIIVGCVTQIWMFNWRITLVCLSNEAMRKFGLDLI